MEASNGDASRFSIIAEKTVNSAYADSVTFETSLWGVTLEFGKTQKPPPNYPGKTPHVPSFRVHMSPQHAKVMAKVFIKNMAAYEEKFGKIQIPAELYRELGLEEDPS